MRARSVLIQVKYNTRRSETAILKTISCILILVPEIAAHHQTHSSTLLYYNISTEISAIYIFILPSYSIRPNNKTLCLHRKASALELAVSTVPSPLCRTVGRCLLPHKTYVWDDFKEMYVDLE